MTGRPHPVRQKDVPKPGLQVYLNCCQIQPIGSCSLGQTGTITGNFKGVLMTHALTTYDVTMISDNDDHHHCVSTTSPFDAIVMALDEFKAPEGNFAIMVKVKNEK